MTGELHVHIFCEVRASLRRLARTKSGRGFCVRAHGIRGLGVLSSFHVAGGILVVRTC